MNKICIVEDEAIIAKDWAWSLQNEGYNVCAIARNYTEALFAAIHFHPHFFLMDIHVEGKYDGIQIATEIQQLIKTNIIFHSSDSPSQHADRLARICYLGYLEKPAHQQALFDILNLV